LRKFLAGHLGYKPLHSSLAASKPRSENRFCVALECDIFIRSGKTQKTAQNGRESSLAEITTLFWDIGGVILTNGWDRESRKQAAATFRLDWEEFQDRHDLSIPAFDTGQITLNEYLDRTLFYRKRSFTREEFTAFMFAQSREYPEVRAILDQVTKSGKYFVGAINNEPLELNQYRIEAYHLRRNFLVFFSSCYVRSRKP
jgi:putative hydrolase of the HAD superfamily